MINGDWITNFLSTLRRLKLLEPSGQALFRPGWPVTDQVHMRLAFMHLKMKKEDGKTETQS